MEKLILIDMESLRVVKAADNTHALEYWAELLLKNKDFRIQDCSARSFAVFSMMELSWLYSHLEERSGSFKEYGDLLQAVRAAVERVVVDDTSVEALAKKLGRKVVPASPAKEMLALHKATAPSGLPWQAAQQELELPQVETAPAAAKNAKAVSKLPAEPKPPKQPRVPASPSGRPAAGSATGKVWDIADKIYKKKGGDKSDKALRVAVIETCVKEGVNQSTAGVQFGKWKVSA